MDIFSTSHAGTAGDLPRVFGKYQMLKEISTNTTSQTPGKKGNEDNVTLSPEGQELARSRTPAEKDTNTPAGQKGTKLLDSNDIRQLQELKQRDTEVRTHEQAHLATAGQYSRGGASYTYQKGPDGVSYAVGGEVGIDVSKEKTPEATITKMQTIKRAALAPASPSGADRSIAAHASVMEAQARQEILLQRQEELLHAAVVENPASGQELSLKNQKSKNFPSFPGPNSLQTIIAAYQRVASN
jgi:hypothetical protein